MMEPDDLLCAEDVAELLGVKPAWIHLMDARKDIPSLLVGARWLARGYRFRRSEIEAWIAANPEREE
jgi:predicted DNA-binding transcriptional regulator AlpA